jgi:hypothetical protein
MDSLEDQLRSLAPRNPSASLKGRIFSKSHGGPGSSLGGGEARWGWLAPVVASLAVLMAIESSRSPMWTPPGGLDAATNWLAMVASNQSYAAYIVADFHSGQNSLRQAPPAWAFSRSAPDPEFWPLTVTNSLMR